MAGRGRGRGKASLSFDISHLGFNTGSSLPRATLEPAPTYPPLQQRPTPLSATEVDEYLLALSQEFRGSIRDSPFYLKPKTIKKDIVRYTDRYKQNQKSDDKTWEPDWLYLPHELKPSVKRKSTGKVFDPKIPKKNRQLETSKKEEITKKLDSLEVNEANEESGKKVNENEDEGDYEDVEEEEFEDDNDYNFDYYNDGGDKYGEDDDGEEGPIY